MTRPMTPKQTAFVAEYLVDMNATQAALRAGYSHKTAAKISHELTINPVIAAAIDERVRDRSIKTGSAAHNVILELGRIAYSDIRNLFDQQGRLLPMHLLPQDVAASIASVEIVTTRIPGTEPAEVQYTVKVKLWNKNEALSLLGRHHRQFVDRVEIDVGESLANRMKEARERLALLAQTI